MTQRVETLQEEEEGEAVAKTVVAQPQYPKAQPPSRTFQAGHESAFRPLDPDRDRPLKSKGEDRLYLDVVRAELGDGSPEEAEDGWCGTVDDDPNFKSQILKKWGGGVYVVTGRYQGQDVEKRIKLPGKSKQIVVEREDEEEAEIDYEPRGPNYGRRPYPYEGHGRADPYGRDPYGHDPYTSRPPYGPHYGQSPYGQAPYGQPPYGQQSPYGPQGAPFQSPPPAYGAFGPQAPPAHGLFKQIDDPKESALEKLRAEMEAQRAELEEAREDAAREREERRVEAERAEARRRELELKAQIEATNANFQRQAESHREQMEALRALIADSKSDKGDTMLSQMLQMQMQESQQRNAAREADRLERDIRIREEQAKREADAVRREKEWKHEAQQKAEDRKIELERMEKERDRDRQFMQQQMEMSRTGQQTPDQMLGMLKTVMDMNPRKDATSQIMDIANAAVAMKEILGGANEESSTQGIIRTAGEAAANAFRELRGGGAPAQVAEEARMLQAAAEQHQQHLPYDAEAHAAHLQAQAEDLQQREAALARGRQQVQPPADPTRDPTPEEWGRIVKFVVESYVSGNDIEDTVPHLNTFLSGLGVPAVMIRLEGATPAMLRWQIDRVGGQIPKGHPNYQAFEAFAAMLSDPRGSAWVAALLDGVRSYLAGIRAAKKAHQEAMLTQERERARAAAVREANMRSAQEQAQDQDQDQEEAPVEPPPGEHEE